ncbi:MAG: DNA recombination protein RmuC [Clostridia bacterium]|nr:DNA recombination protein RmuC [Clostridia bacterium]
MDILLVALNIITIILLSALLFLVIKGKGKEEKDSTEEIRKAVASSVNEMGSMLISSISVSNKSYSDSVEKEIAKLTENMNRLTDSQTKNHIATINTLNASFKDIMQINSQNNEAVAKSIKEKLEDFSKTLSSLIEKINNDVKENLSAIRKENTEKLENIQKTVDEKLEKTLNTRLQQSFENVIKQIGEVNNAIGEIKGLAKDVSSLNNVLSNAKVKGIVGEIVLGNLIRELLAREQYEENIATRRGATERVEFAVKMPGDENAVYLPIDSKFPLESYTRLKEAIDECNKEKIDANRKLLRQNIKKFAKDIHDKYIAPPYTTDFAIMFLPIEGLYLEAIDMGLFEELQRDYKITVTGPSTLTAFLNALQMGFKTLAIQKRSAEVFVLLSAVKTEFEKFAGILDKAHKKVEEASNELSTLAGTRTRAIQRKLRDIAMLPGDEAEQILNLDTKED